MSTPDSALGYAYWIAPDGSSKVTYSLSLFNEIHNFVNDGYRRIPHGGVETSGLLFGRRSGNAVQLEAFRPIQCQHAFGPSFVLSEDDLAGINEQLALAAADEDLKGFQAVGWFIGHTRSPLNLSDREALWFDTLFPEPGSLTVLVKPERFQPTRFGFLLRRPDGQLERDATQSAIILPLSGQTASSGHLASPSIPAPTPVEKPAQEMPAQVATPEQWQSKPAAGVPTRVRTPYSEPIPVAPAPQPAAPQLPATHAYSVRPEFNTGEAARLAYPYASLAQTRARTQKRRDGRSVLRPAAVLVMAALLGCIAGYWAYLQLPSPVIPVSVHEQRGQLVVAWPSTQTGDVDYAALQINGGQWITLSAEQKSAGQAIVTAPPGDVTIDLLAKHWLRDSRGIVRYLRAAKPASPITTAQ
ncbi:MAG: hypothetical protein JO210_10200 [Acidobacteriaceae bacterium]|nr:hypothetical protein [Acidobacteriaceae bacterium]